MSFLELKESNSPFWLLGISKNKVWETPIHDKSKPKQKEAAIELMKDNEKIEDVYLVSGTIWDNMPSNTKESIGYIKNKGTKIASKSDLTESDYPKGISRDPLPKKGVKTYTNQGLPLECDKTKFKPELKDVTESDKAIDDDTTPVYIRQNDEDEKYFELYNKDGKKVLTLYDKDSNIDEIKKQLTKLGFKHVEDADSTVDDPEPIEESATKLEKGEGSTFENAGETWKVIKQNNEDTLIVALDKEGNEKDRYVVAWGLQKDGSWNQGHYFTDKDKAMKYFNEREKKQESLKESYSKDEFIKKYAYCTSKYDIYCLKNNKDNFFIMKKGETPWENKEVTQTDIDGVKYIDKLKLKESKIVQPVGMPQVSDSFVNIDVDLDHMEVSDFIVRLAQAIRSEQKAVLEYVALRSANGVTNDDRSTIDAVIEEEKNHMVAFTTMLYKQVLMNHSENVDKANDEFTLPKLGNEEVFDNFEEGKLTESVSLVLDKILTEGVDLKKELSDIIGDNKVIDSKDSNGIYIVNKNNEVLYVGKNDDNTYWTWNFDISSNQINKLAKAQSTYKDEFVNEGGSTNGIKTIDELKKEISKSNIVTEDINVKFDSSNTSMDRYSVEVDVEYDADFAVKITTNLRNAIEKLNKDTFGPQKFGICETDGNRTAWQLGDKFKFTLLTFNGFDKNVDEIFLKDVCERLFKVASTYEYFIKLA